MPEKRFDKKDPMNSHSFQLEFLTYIFLSINNRFQKKLKKN